MSDVEGAPFSKAKQADDGVGKLSRPCRRCDSGKSARSCQCPGAIGARSRRKGKVGERKARRGIERVISGRLVTNLAQAAVGEEAYGGPVRLEIKSGGRFANPVGLRFLKLEDQSAAAKAEGDPRPFMGVVLPDGWGEDGVVLIRLSDLRSVLEALGE